ncbi:dihydrofolate reductase family protein [Aquimarina spongiae]|uniref:dihydrofolate reductase family protein n=1 Tax=Aquimarina spongiae TaxID=570521 RepID=UPI003CC8002C
MGKIELVKGDLKKVLESIHKKGFHHLYIDGGKTIQSFLNEDLIDEMIITIIPRILGDGIPLFDNIKKQLDFECVDSKIFLGKVVQNRFVRKV